MDMALWKPNARVRMRLSLAAIVIMVGAFAGDQSAFSAVTEPDYLGAAAAWEQCTGRRLPLVAQMRLTQRMRREGLGQISMLDISDSLEKARRAPSIDCDHATAQEQVKFFTESVLPQLQEPAYGP